MKKTWASFRDDAAKQAGPTRKGTAAAWQPLSSTAPKGRGDKNPPSRQTLGSIFMGLEEEMARGATADQVTGCSQRFISMVRDLEGHD